MSEISSSLSLLRLLSFDRAESILRDNALIDRSGTTFSLGLSTLSAEALREDDPPWGERLGLSGEGALGDESVAASILIT